MNFDKLYKPGLLLLALLMFVGVGLSQWRLNDLRAELKLTRLVPLENAPPALAFTTIALGGFRGLIANVLWMRASDLQQDEKFFEMVQLADWITKLQPHFVTVWVHQAWNMAYNISVKFPESKDRWLWVSRGIELLRDEGMKFNPDEPLIYRELAWFYQHKMGANLDQSHLYYKQMLQRETAKVLGSTRQSWMELLNPQTDDAKRRAKILREKLKLDPERIKKVDDLYGPLEWRLPEAHAIYWASFGLEKCIGNRARTNDIITLRRVIYQSMQLAFQRGRLVEINFGASTFSPNDLVDLPALTAELKQPGRPIDTWLAGQLSPVTQKALTDYKGSESLPGPVVVGLVQDLNRIIQGALVYDAERFAKVELRVETRQLLTQNPQGDELLWLNRLLIEDAYPQELSINHKAFQFGPNIDIIPKANHAYEQMMLEDAVNRDHISNGHRNFVIQVITTLYTHNRETDAKKWLEYMAAKYPDFLRQQYPHAVKSGLNLDEFVLPRVAEMMDGGKDKTQTLLEGFLYRSFYSLAIDEDDESVSLERMAKKLWVRYQDKTQGTDPGRVDLPPYSEIKRTVLTRMLNPRGGLGLPMIHRLRTKMGLPAAATATTAPPALINSPLLPGQTNSPQATTNRPPAVPQK